MKALLILLLAVACSTPKKNTQVIELTPPSQHGPDIFVTDSSLEWMIGLAKAASCVVNLPEVKEDMAKIQDLDWTDDSGRQVAAKIATVQSDMKTYTSNLVAYGWRRFWPGFAPVTGYVNVGDTTIWLNLRANPRPIEAMVASVCHEHGHVIGYGHGSNGAHTTGVPNELAKICMKHIGRCL